MARIKPVVASDVGWHRELIADTQTGFLFPAGDVHALAKLLSSVVSDPTKATEVAANGRRYVETHLTWDVVADKYSGIYEELLSRPVAQRSTLTSLRLT